MSRSRLRARWPCSAPGRGCDRGREGMHTCSARVMASGHPIQPGILRGSISSLCQIKRVAVLVQIMSTTSPSIDIKSTECAQHDFSQV